MLFPALALALLQTPPAADAALVPPALLLRWRTVTSEVARTGDAGLVEELRTLLAELGDEPAELERLAQTWRRTAAGAKPARGARTAVARRIERELPALVAELEELAGERQLALARCILVLDHDEPGANALLGRARDAEGAWLAPEELAWKDGARALAEHEREVRALDFEHERGASDNPALRALGGGSFVRAHGLELHAALPPETLTRILDQTLRAAAFSRALLGGKVTAPVLAARRVYVLLDSPDAFETVLAEARTVGRMSAEAEEEIRRHDFHSFPDPRGWSTLRWRPETDFAAFLLWELAPTWLGADAQPCLAAGHVNSVCLRFLGTSLPLIAWREVEAAGAAAQRTLAAQDPHRREALWRATRRSFLGTRAWMVRAVRAGTDPPWSRAMLDHAGKIVGENLLKTTLVCELLHVEGRLDELCAATRARTDVPAAMEAALGSPLPEFEARWRRWLDPQRRVGVRARLEAEPAASAGPGPFDAALRALNQARANAHKGAPLEIPLVALDAELARGAALHARYLAQNPDLQTAWPGAHEEYAGRPGFSAEGALSASRSLLSYGTTPEGAIEEWLATFYHRLPLLDPGLFGVGFAAEDGVVVADVHSLVLDPARDHVALWPMDDARDVPRAFHPEQPNPVPGSDMAALGFPVSVQLYFVEPTRRVTLELELWQGEPESGARVACHVLSPDAPLFTGLVPRNAWALVPERWLDARTRYTAVARFGGETRRWSFTTAK